MHRIAFLLLFLALPVSAQDDPRLMAYMDSVVAADGFNGSVYVVHESSILLDQGYGFADVERGLENSSVTKFRIGSITKQFTAMGIMILQEQGRLDVHDRLDQHLDDLPPAWRGLTIHQLLTHTSGLMHSWALPDFRATMHEPADLHQTVARFRDQPLLFEPGTAYHYSGLGYFILAQIIERRSRLTYRGFMQANIFDVADMENATVDDPIIPLAQRAIGYVRVNERLEPAPAIHMPILTGGGNLLASVNDFDKWDLALKQEMFISPEAYEQMYTPGREQYAYGWRVGQGPGGRWLRHGGSVPGFQSHIIRVPERRTLVVVLSNVAPMPAGRIAEGLARLVLTEQ